MSMRCVSAVKSCAAYLVLPSTRWILLTATLIAFSRISLATTYTWTGSAGDGNWATPGNWSPSGGPPGAADSAIINSGTVSANTPVSVANLTVNGGTLSGTADVTVTGTMTWNGGTMSGSGKTTVAAGATFTGPNVAAQMNLLRTVEIAGSGSITNGHFGMSGGTLSILAGGTLTVASTSNFGITFGQSTGVNQLLNAGTLTKSGNFTTTIGVAFSNTGTVDVQQGTLNVSSGGSNRGSMIAESNATLLFSNGFTYNPGSTVTGPGTVAFNGGTHSFSAGTFGTSGPVLFNGGAITFSDPMSFPSVALPSGASVQFNGGLTITPPGSLSVTNGTLNYGSSNLSVAALTIGGSGTLTGSGNVTVTSSMNWNGGWMQGSGKTTVAAGATFTGPNDVGQMSLLRTLEIAGSGSITNGHFGMSGGTLSILAGGTLTVASTSNFGITFGQSTGVNQFLNAGTLTKSGNFTTTIAVPFTNTGTVDVQQGTLNVSSGGSNSGSMIAKPGATLLFSSNFTYNPGSTVTGAGTVAFNGGTHSFPPGTFGVTGPVLFNGGAITFSDPMSLPSVALPSGASVQFNGGLMITPPGSLSITNGLLNYGNSNLSVANLTIGGSGTLTGSGNVTVTSAMSWNGGTMSGSGKTTVAAGATFTGPNIAAQMNLLRTLEIAGSGSITNGHFGMAGGTFSILAGGILTVASTGNSGVTFGQSTGSNQFLNAGTFSKSGNFTTTLAVNFTNTGTVDVQQGTLSVSSGVSNLNTGTATLSGGTWKVSGGGALSLGIVRIIAPSTTVQVSGAGSSLTNWSALNSVQGELRILSNATFPSTPQGGTLSNTGKLVLGTGGLLNLTGAFTQTGASLLRFELGGLATSQFGRIAATTQATIAGGVTAKFITPYVPVLNDAFSVVTAPTVTGAFTQVCVDQLIGGLGVTPSLTPGTMGLIASPSGTSQPAIVTPPQNTIGCPAGASLSVTASGNVLSYQWQKETSPGSGLYAPLTDGPTGNGSTISGAQLATLQIASARSGDDGRYNVIATNACGTITSTPASLSTCTSDLSCDQQVDDADFVLFATAYDLLVCDDPNMPAGCPSDLNGDSQVDDADFVIFASAYDAFLCS
ncbi:MAG: hypothetical protein U0573_11480 [Phycisphaerales bacterium]|nr:immunoglobulin domain-containing protein [Planctomycetota bacterium]